MTAAARFWMKVRVAPADACWEWRGALDGKGYGQCRWDGRVQRAHRVAYTLAVGVIPDGMTIDHRCRNRVCVNPGHMDVVSGAENTRRARWSFM